MRDEIDVDCVNNAMNSLIRDCQDFQAENAALKTKVAELTAHNSAIVQLLEDCQDVICNCVFLDDNGHSALMDRINAVVAQLTQ